MSSERDNEHVSLHRMNAEGWSTFIFGKGEPRIFFHMLDIVSPPNIRKQRLVFAKGIRHPLQESELCILPHRYETKPTVEGFKKVWSRELNKPHPSLTKAVVRYNAWSWFGVFILDFFYNASILVNPTLISYIVSTLILFITLCH